MSNCMECGAVLTEDPHDESCPAVNDPDWVPERDSLWSALQRMADAGIVVREATETK